nr:hypothetical protein KitaXyl93_20560 [Kitasatospora sp. Xyl93]
MTPTAEQLDHLIGHTANHALTPEEHAALRAGVAELTEQRDTARAGALERAALLEHARDLLEPFGGHGDAWPDITPAIEALIARATQAEARIAAVRALAADMRTWCSPHGIAADYADRIDAALGGPEPAQP